MTARVLVAVLALVLGSACLTSHGLLQTAHTEPPRELRVKAGVAGVVNENASEAGRGLDTNMTPEPSLRLGLTDFMDAGLAPWLVTGASLDAKVNLLDNRDRAALAPRMAAGYAFGDRSAFGLELGCIGSYRLQDGVEPYAGLHFANHWFSSSNGERGVPLSPNQQYARRRGYGDGLLKTAFGVDFRVAGLVHLLVEYAHWFPVNDDPGDGYSFLPNHIVAVAVSIEHAGK